jgi:hypothetical protein
VKFGSNDVSGVYTVDVGARKKRDVEEISRLQNSIPSKTSISPRTNITDTISNIPNPVICLELNSAMVFEINAPSNFPIYARNDLRNSNPVFDYGDFRQLEYFMTHSDLVIEYFTFVFTEPGVYVFTDYTFPTREVLVKVSETADFCETLPPIQPSSRETYQTLGVEVGIPGSITLPTEIILGIVIAVIVIVILLVLMYLFLGPGKSLNKKPWEKLKNLMPQYRMLDHPVYNLPKWLNKENKKAEDKMQVDKVQENNHESKEKNRRVRRQT